jgi:hypothetical protein
MSNETLISKIELLQEQIDNLEKSGFFTEKEMDKLSSPLRLELNLLQTQKRAFENELFGENQRILGLASAVDLADLVKAFRECFNHSSIPNKYGMSDLEYEEARVKHNAFFNPIKALEIEVIDAEILTPNYQEA